MDLEQAIYSRRADREYTDDDLGRPVLQKSINMLAQPPQNIALHRLHELRDDPPQLVERVSLKGRYVLPRIFRQGSEG